MNCVDSSSSDQREVQGKPMMGQGPRLVWAKQRGWEDRLRNLLVR